MTAARRRRCREAQQRRVDPCRVAHRAEVRRGVAVEVDRADRHLDDRVPGLAGAQQQLELVLEALALDLAEPAQHVGGVGPQAGLGVGEVEPVVRKNSRRVRPLPSLLRLGTGPVNCRAPSTIACVRPRPVGDGAARRRGCAARRCRRRRRPRPGQSAAAWWNPVFRARPLPRLTSCRTTTAPSRRRRRTRARGPGRCRRRRRGRAARGRRRGGRDQVDEAVVGLVGGDQDDHGRPQAPM